MESKWKSLQGTFVHQPFCAPFPTEPLCCHRARHLCPALQKPLEILHLILLIFTGFTWGQPLHLLRVTPDVCLALWLRWESFAIGMWDCVFIPVTVPAVCRELLSETYSLCDKMLMFFFFGNRETKKFWVSTNIPLVLCGHSAVLPGAGNVYSPGVNESRQKQWRNRLCKPEGLSMHNSSISSAAKSI